MAQLNGVVEVFYRSGLFSPSLRSQRRTNSSFGCFRQASCLRIFGQFKLCRISEERKMPLISGLPDDIAHFCLARVPRGYHSILKCVSRGWRDLVCSEEWSNYRRKCNLDESWIYALCHDKFYHVCLYVLNPNSSRRSWIKIHVQSPCIRRREGMGFAALGKRLYVLGGCGWSEDATDGAYCYDASMNTWLEISPLSTERCYFTCEVLDGKIHAVGGLGLKPGVPQSWDTYDPSTKTWKCSLDSNIVPEIEDSFVMDGKIFIRGGGSSTMPTVKAAVYEPSTGTWQRVDDDMVSGWRGPAVVVAGNLYVLDQSFGTTLLTWCKETGKWIRLGRLSSFVMKPPCRLVANRKSIFVIGKDCRTVVIDVESVTNMMDGVMVCSSIPKILDDVDVISCKCVSI